MLLGSHKINEVAVAINDAEPLARCLCSCLGSSVGITLVVLLTPSLPGTELVLVLQYQDQFGSWKRWGEKHNEGDAYRTAKARAKATGKRFRIVDGNGNLVDLVTP